MWRKNSVKNNLDFTSEGYRYRTNKGKSVKSMILNVFSFTSGKGI